MEEYDKIMSTFEYITIIIILILTQIQVVISANRLERIIKKIGDKK